MAAGKGAMEGLPDELILLMIAYLEPSELVVLQHVSRRFLSLSRDNRLWRSLCFTHSAAERRRQRLESTVDLDPRLAELITAANSMAMALDTPVWNPSAPSADAQQARNRHKKWEALRTSWDPTFPGETVNWYRDFVQRHAPPRVAWFEPVAAQEAMGVGMLAGAAGRGDRLVAPMDDGRICIWHAAAHSDRRGQIAAASAPGLLSTGTVAQTGAVECVSVDSSTATGFFAVDKVLAEVDLNTLQVVARTPFPYPITALSPSQPRTPLTVGTNWSLHLHDPRKPPSPATATAADTSFSRLATGDFGGHVSLAQPGALSILHLPTTREWDANGDIWVAGRFTSILNFDRRFFPRLRGTLHSGARISCLAALPHPFISNSLRTTFPPSQLHAAKASPGFTLVTAGEYKGKGSLELYGLSPDPSRSVNSSDNRSTRNPQACYLNRQTASSSKLLSVASHGTRLVFTDGDGNLKWVERDGSTPVRQFNINQDIDNSTSNQAPTESSVMGSVIEAGRGEIVQKILPTNNSSLVASPLSGDLADDDLIIWTGDGRLGIVSFGTDPGFDEDVFEDALEIQGSDAGIKVREREYSMEMRRALEMQARELRWLRGYGL